MLKQSRSRHASNQTGKSNNVRIYTVFKYPYIVYQKTKLLVYWQFTSSYKIITNNTQRIFSRYVQLPNNNVFGHAVTYQWQISKAISREQ